jgi:sulfite reductase (NADPH) flavoprotein alpha-component
MTSKTVKSVCPYCGVGCGIVMEVADNRVIKVSGDRAHPSNFGRLCTKGSTCAQPLAAAGRLQQAYVRGKRQQDPVPVGLDEAIVTTAERLRAVLEAHGPDALALYVSGQMSLEAQYLANKLAKGYLRTRHVESNSRLCMASAGTGYKLSLGSDGPPGSYQDFEHADLFFVIGANMADCHPILFLRLLDRRKAGARLIVVDPRRTATAEKADLFLQIRPGSDLALLNGLLHLLWLDGRCDEAFIAEFTEGWEAMPDFLADYPPARVAGLTGLDEADIRRAAQWIGEAGAWMSLWTMGLNQSTHGTWSTNALCNLHLATGAICRPGAGPFSLTGQPNAMGGREMGYMGPGLPGQRSVLVEEDRAFVEAVWQLPPGSLRSETGDGTLALFEAMKAGEIKACWIICTNPVASVANRDSVIQALQSAEVVVVQDAFLDTETNRYADILLPGALWAEADGVMVNSERNLTLAPKAVEPPGEALADWQIIARVACAMGYAEAFSYASAGEVFEEIVRFHNPASGYDIRGVSHASLAAGPQQWPCPPEGGHARHPLRYLNDGVSQTWRRDVGGRVPRLAFATPSGKARFFPRPHQEPAEQPDEAFPFVLNTGRLQHQWHTLTKTGKVAALNRLNPGPFVEIHPEDAERLGLRDQDRLEVRSRRGSAVLPVVTSERVLPGNCFAPFHWSDLFGERLAVNAVTSDAVDPLSRQPELKFAAVSLTRVTLIEHRQLEEDAPVRLAAGREAALALFARAAGVADWVAPVLDEPAQRYLAGFVAGLRQRPAPTLPALPAQAPLSAETRLWFDGLLAGLLGEARSPVADTAANVTLLWASQTGNAEALAERLAGRLREAGLAVSLACMAEFAVDRLATAGTVLLVSSTFGDGEAPDNGQSFWQGLDRFAGELPSLRYAVFALGDPSYDRFCQHGRNLDRRLAELGATALLPRRECDADHQDVAESWLAELLPQLQPGMELAVAAPAAAGKETPVAARLTVNLRLNTGNALKDTRMFALDVADSGLRYEAGDALGVWPRNCPALVEEVLSLARLDGDRAVRVGERGELPMREALERHFEIARPSRESLALVAERSGSDTLRRLLDDKAALNDWLWGRQLADVLQAFPAAHDAEALLASLRRLQPRLYSIASSPKAYPDEVHLTVAAVRYGKRKGVASTFLADRAQDGETPVFVQRSRHFRPPQEGDAPIIMIGPGTGVAPFRGFLQERRARGDRGRNWLFFGEQHQATDFYYRDELLALHQDGLLTHLSLAFSRDQAQKIYVQDRIRENGAELWRWLQEGAYLYVCGDASRMAKDVDQALRDVARLHGGLDEDGAAVRIRGLAGQKRYLRDVY